MNPTSEDIKDMLEDSASGLGLVFATDLFVAKEPDDPDLCVTIFDTSGLEPDHTIHRLDYPGAMVRVRGKQGGYLEAYALAENIKEYLRGIHGETWNGTRYIGIWAMSDILPIGWDSKDRPKFSLNFRIQRTTTT